MSTKGTHSPVANFFFSPGSVKDRKISELIIYSNIIFEIFIVLKLGIFFLEAFKEKLVENLSHSYQIQATPFCVRVFKTLQMTLRWLEMTFFIHRNY